MTTGSRDVSGPSLRTNAKQSRSFGLSGIVFLLLLGRTAWGRPVPTGASYPFYWKLFYAPGRMASSRRWPPPPASRFSGPYFLHFFITFRVRPHGPSVARVDLLGVLPRNPFVIAEISAAPEAHFQPETQCSKVYHWEPRLTFNAVKAPSDFI